MLRDILLLDRNNCFRSSKLDTSDDKVPVIPHPAKSSAITDVPLRLQVTLSHFVAPGPQGFAIGSPQFQPFVILQVPGQSVSGQLLIKPALMEHKALASRTSTEVGKVVGTMVGSNVGSKVG